MYPHDWAATDENQILFCVSSGLSILGCILIFITYVLFKDLQTTSRHIIVCISIADFAACASNIFGIASQPDQHQICILQSFIGTSFIQSSFLWTVALAVFLYVTIAHENKELADRLVWPWFHIICWLLPLTINVVALNLHMLGNTFDRTSSGWCWIDVSNKHDRTVAIAWMFADGKGIEILSYISVLILYALIKLHLRKSINCYERSDSPSRQFLCQRTVQAARNADRKLIFIPFCFVILRIWGTLRFLFYVLNYDNKSSLSKTEHVLLYMQAVGDNLQGFVNFILFCLFTTKVRNHIRDCIICHHAAERQRLLPQ